MNRIFHFALFTTLLLLLDNTAALRLVQPRDVSPSVVKLGIQRKAVDDPVKRDSLRRRQTVSQTLDNDVSQVFLRLLPALLTMCS